MKTVFFTGKGDDGKSRVGKKLVCKDNPLLGILGRLDGLNSWIGFARVVATKEEATREIDEALRAVQEMLFIAQAEVAAIGFELPVGKRIRAAHLTELEAIIGRADKEIPPIVKFVIPGGSELAGRLDVARTEARGLERAAAAYRDREFSKEFLAFMNRLSSALFALARLANLRCGVPERHPSYE